MSAKTLKSPPSLKDVEFDLHKIRQRKPPEPLRSLTAAFERDAQAHADYWREAFCAVRDKTTGIITLVTAVRAPYVDNSLQLKAYSPCDTPAEFWPESPACHAGVPQGIETVPGFREAELTRRKQTLTAREETFAERSPSTNRTSNAAKMVLNGGPRARMQRF